MSRIGSSLDTRTRAHVFNAHIKPDLDFCPPVWGTHGSAHVTAMNRLLLRAKRHATNQFQSTTKIFIYLV